MYYLSGRLHQENRARILYNHLYFYKVPKDCIENLLVDGRIMKLISHPGYSPRLIEAVTSQLKWPDSSHFYDCFLDTLDHPNKLWEHAFCRQISPAARNLLILMCACPRSMYLSGLRTYFESFHRCKALAENRSLSGNDFQDALRETEGSFIRIDRCYVSYHNPSVRDFIQGYLLEHREEFRMMCESAADFDFCINLADLNASLCTAEKQVFLDALNRTMNTARSFSGNALRTPILQTKQLFQINQKLHFPEIDEKISVFTQRLPELLLQEKNDLTASNWHQKEEPHELRELLSSLDSNRAKTPLSPAVYDACLQYSLAWFHFSSLYSLEDFLLFQDISAVHPFDKDADCFRPVYEALRDFDLHLAFDYIEEIDYEEDCEDYRDQIMDLEKLFSVRLSNARAEIDDHIWKLRNTADEEEVQAPQLLPPPERIRNDAEILDMFQSLLEHSSDQ